MVNTFVTTKLNLKQAWDKTGRRIPVTVLSAPPMTISQLKTISKDGYNAVQVALGTTKKPNQPSVGHLKKSKLNSARYLTEIKLSHDKELQSYQLGGQIKVDDVLSVGDLVSITAKSKGRGFTGVMKRWGFSGGPRTHGQSDRQRAPGSIGQGTTPGRVFKGKKMAGCSGNQQFTIKNLVVVKLDSDNQQVWVKGTVPGPKGGLVKLTKSGTSKFSGLLSLEKPAQASSNPSHSSSSQLKSKSESSQSGSKSAKPTHKSTTPKTK